MTGLELRGLSKTYPGFEFGPVDLSVGSEVVSVLGPSGSGKTTLLSLVAGIVQPDSGEMSLDGRSLVGEPLETRRVGIVFQDGALFPHMTARENIAYAATNSTAELVTMLEIEDVLDRRPAALSGGERQRVALARTLAAEPSALLLDEPLSSLDTPIQRRLRDKLHDLFSSLDIPVVYVTHDQRAATVLGDRVAVIRDGEIEQVGSPTELLDRPASPFVARFTGSENVFSATVVAATEEGVRLQVGSATLSATGERRHSGERVTACVRPSRLELTANPGENTLGGVLVRRVNEGDTYRLTVDVDVGDDSLALTIHTAADDQAAVDPGESVVVSVPANAIHVLPRQQS